MTDVITRWLSGPRNYREGVALYDRYGHNRMLKRRFALDDTAMNRDMLAVELGRLAGLTASAVAAMPRHARGAGPAVAVAATTRPVAAEEAPAVNATVEPLTPVERRYVSFRERFPFLREPSCPDRLKVMVADMFAAHDRYVAAHARLLEADSAATRSTMADAEEAVTAYIDNRAMWEELEYYREHGVMLGAYSRKATEDDAATVTAVDDDDLTLARRLGNARANESKARKRLEALMPGTDAAAAAADKLAKWTAAVEVLTAEAERRKKK